MATETNFDRIDDDDEDSLDVLLDEDDSEDSLDVLLSGDKSKPEPEPETEDSLDVLKELEEPKPEVTAPSIVKDFEPINEDYKKIDKVEEAAAKENDQYKDVLKFWETQEKESGVAVEETKKISKLVQEVEFSYDLLKEDVGNYLGSGKLTTDEKSNIDAFLSNVKDDVDTITDNVKAVIYSIRDEGQAEIKKEIKLLKRNLIINLRDSKPEITEHLSTKDRKERDEVYDKLKSEITYSGGDLEKLHNIERDFEKHVDFPEGHGGSHYTPHDYIGDKRDLKDLVEKLNDDEDTYEISRYNIGDNLLKNIDKHGAEVLVNDFFNEFKKSLRDKLDEEQTGKVKSLISSINSVDRRYIKNEINKLTPDNLGDEKDFPIFSKGVRVYYGHLENSLKIVESIINIVRDYKESSGDGGETSGEDPSSSPDSQTVNMSETLNNLEKEILKGFEGKEIHSSITELLFAENRQSRRSLGVLITKIGVEKVKNTIVDSINTYVDFRGRNVSRIVTPLSTELTNIGEGTRSFTDALKDGYNRTVGTTRTVTAAADNDDNGPPTEERKLTEDEKTAKLVEDVDDSVNELRNDTEVLVRHIHEYVKSLSVSNPVHKRIIFYFNENVSKEKNNGVENKLRSINPSVPYFPLNGGLVGRFNNLSKSLQLLTESVSEPGKTETIHGNPFKLTREINEIFKKMNGNRNYFMEHRGISKRGKEKLKSLFKVMSLKIVDFNKKILKYHPQRFNQDLFSELKMRSQEQLNREIREEIEEKNIPKTLKDLGYEMGKRRASLETDQKNLEGIISGFNSIINKIKEYKESVKTQVGNENPSVISVLVIWCDGLINAIPDNLENIKDTISNALLRAPVEEGGEETETETGKDDGSYTWGMGKDLHEAIKKFIFNFMEIYYGKDYLNNIDKERTNRRVKLFYDRLSLNQRTLILKNEEIKKIDSLVSGQILSNLQKSWVPDGNTIIERLSNFVSSKLGRRSNATLIKIMNVLSEGDLEKVLDKETDWENDGNKEILRKIKRNAGESLEKKNKEEKEKKKEWWEVEGEEEGEEEGKEGEKEEEEEEEEKETKTKVRKSVDYESDPPESIPEPPKDLPKPEIAPVKPLPETSSSISIPKLDDDDDDIKEVRKQKLKTYLTDEEASNVHRSIVRVLRSHGGGFAKKYKSIGFNHSSVDDFYAKLNSRERSIMESDGEIPKDLSKVLRDKAIESFDLREEIKEEVGDIVTPDSVLKFLESFKDAKGEWYVYRNNVEDVTIDSLELYKMLKGTPTAFSRLNFSDEIKKNIRRRLELSGKESNKKNLEKERSSPVNKTTLYLIDKAIKDEKKKRDDDKPKVGDFTITEELINRLKTSRRVYRDFRKVLKNNREIYSTVIKKKKGDRVDTDLLNYVKDSELNAVGVSSTLDGYNKSPNLEVELGDSDSEIRNLEEDTLYFARWPRWIKPEPSKIGEYNKSLLAVIQISEDLSDKIKKNEIYGEERKKKLEDLWESIRRRRDSIERIPDGFLEWTDKQISSLNENIKLKEKNIGKTVRIPVTAHLSGYSDNGLGVDMKQHEKIVRRYIASLLDSKDWEDQIPGGMADGYAPADFPRDQMEKGMEVEKEHSDDSKLAVEIAMDHLQEIDDYYDRLEEMEAAAEAEAKAKARAKEKGRN